MPRLDSLTYMGTGLGAGGGALAEYKKRGRIRDFTQWFIKRRADQTNPLTKDELSATMRQYDMAPEDMQPVMKLVGDFDKIRLARQADKRAEAENRRAESKETREQALHPYEVDRLKARTKYETGYSKDNQVWVNTNTNERITVDLNDPDAKLPQGPGWVEEGNLPRQKAQEPFETTMTLLDKDNNIIRTVKNVPESRRGSLKAGEGERWVVGEQKEMTDPKKFEVYVAPDNSFVKVRKGDSPPSPEHLPYKEWLKTNKPVDRRKVIDAISKITTNKDDEYKTNTDKINHISTAIADGNPDIKDPALIAQLSVEAFSKFIDMPTPDTGVFDKVLDYGKSKIGMDTGEEYTEEQIVQAVELSEELAFKYNMPIDTIKTTLEGKGWSDKAINEILEIMRNRYDKGVRAEEPEPEPETVTRKKQSSDDFIRDALKGVGE